MGKVKNELAETFHISVLEISNMSDLGYMMTVHFIRFGEQNRSEVLTLNQSLKLNLRQVQVLLSLNILHLSHA
jgi:hypothetical protein